MGGASSVRTVWQELNSSGGQTIGVARGHPYVLGLEAVSSPGDVPAGGSPFREGVPCGAAMVYSTAFTP